MVSATEDKVMRVKNVDIFSKIRSEKNKRKICGIDMFLKDRHIKISLRNRRKVSGGSRKHWITASFAYHDSRQEKRFS